MDFDGDDDLDVLSGSWPGELYLFTRENDGKYAAAQKLADSQGNLLKPGSASTAFAVDWDADGDLDLLAGNIEGHVLLYANEGTRQEPSFGKGKQLSAGGEAIGVPHGDSGPVAVDWDGDEQLDLVVGAGDGSVLLYRNTGESGSPKLAEAVTLVPASKQQRNLDEGKNKDPLESGPGTRAKVAVADFTGDGRLDLLVGDFLSRVTKRDDLTEEEIELGKKARERYQELVEQYIKLNEQAGDKENDGSAERQKELAERREKLQEALAEYRKYQPTQHNYHGWVWLFERQTPSVAARPAK